MYLGQPPILLYPLKKIPSLASTHRLADLCQYIFGTLEQPNLDLSDYFEPLHLAVNNQILLIFNYNTLAKIQLTFFSMSSLTFVLPVSQ